MPWQNNAGGGGNRGPWGQGPRSSGPQPPNLDEIFRKGQDRFKTIVPRGFGGGKGVIIAILVLLTLWSFTGVYRVLPGEQGVVLIFGKWDGTIDLEGLHFTWPAPISQVFTPKVQDVRKTEVGFTTFDRGRGQVSEQDRPDESLMLTSDENILDLHFEVFWQIKDAGQYLFMIQNPENTVKAVAESAMREVIGNTTLQEGLTTGRQQIEVDTVVLMQSILDDYQSGVLVTEVNLKKSDTPREVIDDFRDVQAAGQDRETEINKAQAYRNKILPEARGEAANITQQAEAYKARVVANAQGEAARFTSVYNEYKQAEDVTKKRMYLETMEQVLKDVNKVIIDSSAGSGVVPYLPLPEVQKRRGAGQ